jgi:hypothetical protein
MTDTAETVLSRFDQQISRAVYQVHSTYPAIDTDDIRLEATVLVVTYAGLMPGRHHGILRHWARAVDNDEAQIRGLLAYELRLDLLRTLGPAEARRIPADSIDAMPPARQPSYEPESKWVDRIDLDGYVSREYPFLVLSAVDGLSDEEIADATGVPLRTVGRHLATERRKAQRDPYFGATDDDTHKFSQAQFSLTT